MDLFDRLFRRRIKPVNDDNDFKVAECLPSHALDSTHKKLRAIECGDDDGDGWRLLIQYGLLSDSRIHGYLYEDATRSIHLNGFSTKPHSPKASLEPLALEPHAKWSAQQTLYSINDTTYTM
jgi:hypothetical protein